MVRGGAEGNEDYEGLGVCDEEEAEDMDGYSEDDDGEAADYVGGCEVEDAWEWSWGCMGVVI